MEAFLEVDQTKNPGNQGMWTNQFYCRLVLISVSGEVKNPRHLLKAFL